MIPGSQQHTKGRRIKQGNIKRSKKSLCNLFHFTGFSQGSAKVKRKGLGKVSGTVSILSGDFGVPKKELFGDFGGINAREKVGECRSSASSLRGKT